jgi:hypothetical protein
MNYPAASGRGIKNYKPQMPSPQSGGVLDPKGNKKQNSCCMVWMTIRVARATTIIICHPMPRRIRIPDGIIIDERVPIPGLRALRGGGDEGVGREEPSQQGCTTRPANRFVKL